MLNLLPSIRRIMPHIRNSRPTLAQRRRAALLRRILIAILAGLTMFFALQSISSSLVTQQVLIATHPLARGSSIKSSDVEPRSISRHAHVDHMPADISQVEGMVAQVSIGAGHPIVSSMIGTQPVVPDGHTSVKVSLASDPAALIVGDSVTLVAPGAGCDTSDIPAPDVCTLSTAAITVATVTDTDADTADDLDSAAGLAGTISLEQGAVFAMPAQDAIRVLAAQRVATIIAVSHAR